MRFNSTDLSDEKLERDRKLFLESFPGEKTFLTLQDNKNIKPKIRLLRTVSVSQDQYPIDAYIDPSVPIIPVKIIRGLDTLNDNGAGIFMCVSETDGKGRKEENVIKIRSCYADFDDIEKGLPEFSIEPSMIVETSPKKFHVYFFSDNIPVECFRGLQEGLIHCFGSDQAVKDPSRTMRVPGFYHNKGKRYISNIVHYTGLKYDFTVLSEKFPPPPRKQWSAPKFKKDLYSDTKEYKGGYGFSKGGRNCGIMKKVGGMVKRNLSWREIEREVWKEAQACSPKLNEFEVKNILRSAKRYAWRYD